MTRKMYYIKMKWKMLGKKKLPKKTASAWRQSQGDERKLVRPSRHPAIGPQKNFLVPALTILSISG